MIQQIVAKEYITNSLELRNNQYEVMSYGINNTDDYQKCI